MEIEEAMLVMIKWTRLDYEPMEQSIISDGRLGAHMSTIGEEQIGGSQRWIRPLPPFHTEDVGRRPIGGIDAIKKGDRGRRRRASVVLNT